MDFSTAPVEQLLSLQDKLFTVVYGNKGAPWCGFALGILGFIAGAGCLLLFLDEGGSPLQAWAMVGGFLAFAFGLKIERSHRHNIESARRLLAEVQAELLKRDAALRSAPTPT